MMESPTKRDRAAKTDRPAGPDSRSVAHSAASGGAAAGSAEGPGREGDEELRLVHRVERLWKELLGAGSGLRPPEDAFPELHQAIERAALAAPELFGDFTLRHQTAVATSVCMWLERLLLEELAAERRPDGVPDEAHFERVLELTAATRELQEHVLALLAQQPKIHRQWELVRKHRRERRAAEQTETTRPARSTAETRAEASPGNLDPLGQEEAA